MTADTTLDLRRPAGTNTLVAAYTPHEGVAAPAWPDLLAALQTRGWDAGVLDQGSAVNFIEACRESAEPVQAAIGEVHDGSFELEISPDRMSVLLSLTPPRGGLPVGLAQVQDELQALGVVYGLRERALDQALEAGRGSVLIAQGTAPTIGTPARFVSLLEALKTRQQEDDDSTPVDYRELGNLTLVAPGTPLMRRMPAEQGQPGLNVLGEAVPPVAVPDTPFARNLTGVEPDPEDPNLLRAANAGSPMVVPQGVLVNSLVEVERVDLATGNIQFDGTLKVRGDIAAGMQVRVSGDVVVLGTIEAARVQAGGNINVNGGIIGLAERRHASRPGDAEAGAARSAHITAGGSVKARFIENAVVNADKSVAAEREIRQSRIYAGEGVTVGPPNSPLGVITGGETHAARAVRAGSIGSLAAVPTLVAVGLHPHAAARREALQQRRVGLQEEQAKLEKLMLFLRDNPARDTNGMSERARATLARVAGEQAQLAMDEQQLNALLNPLADATVVAARRLHGGVTLMVGGKRLEILEDMAGARAELDPEAGQVVLR
ncbi:DUF342 domain-containing protein [Bordetella trematum]|uniref:DUF342 domain-containing protein n=1 Tax=Bordetella trematum TaxID=123899 RepID=UPI003989F3A6